MRRTSVPLVLAIWMLLAALPPAGANQTSAPPPQRSGHPGRRGHRLRPSSPQPAPVVAA